MVEILDENAPNLRRGWTTGACAAAAARAAYAALTGGAFPDPVSITLPGGQTPAFALALTERGDSFLPRGDRQGRRRRPDVTHGALIVARVSRGAPGAGVTFSAGEGVGTVTKPGLPLPVGEPAINPMPRQMIRDALAAEAAAAWRRDRRSCGNFRSRRREDRRAHAQRPARHRRRPVDSRHHRNRDAVFLRGLDRLDPSRHRRRPRHGTRDRRGRDRLDLRSRDQGALRPARGSR